MCGLVEGTTPDCMSCTESDPCLCTCPEMAPYAPERAQLAMSASDLSSGTTTGTIERRYASAYGYYALAGTADNQVSNLFTDFLARTAEQDEIDNGRMMVFGPLIQGSPTGLMFHRLGATYADLIDIIFTSEVYREAIVRRVFQRYLARDPSATELSHFVATLDATDPDARGVIRAVVSSREYFAQ